MLYLNFNKPGYKLLNANFMALENRNRVLTTTTIIVDFTCNFLSSYEKIFLKNLAT